MKLELIFDMIFEEIRLIHGGFALILADYIVILAINYLKMAFERGHVIVIKPVEQVECVYSKIDKYILEEREER